MSDIIQSGQITIDDVIHMALSSVESEQSRRVYGHTYNLWLDYCHNHRHDPLIIAPHAIGAFISAQDTTKATRQRQWSNMRKLAKTIWLRTGSDDFKRVYELMKESNPPIDKKAGKHRDRYVMSNEEVQRALAVWTDDTPRHRRNQAMLYVLLYTGIRRAEAAALQWRDVDFSKRILTIRHGKGDKHREVPVLGQGALEALQSWRDVQPVGYVHVFTPVNQYGKPGADNPVTDKSIYRWVQSTMQVASIPATPHDFRATFITGLLDHGAALHDVQAAAGHSKGDTTMRYAKKRGAQELGKRLTIDYGE